MNTAVIFEAFAAEKHPSRIWFYEAVVGVSSLMDMIQTAVNNNMPMADSGDITIPVYIGGNLIDEMIVSAEQRRALRSGGRA